MESRAFYKFSLFTVLLAHVLSVRIKRLIWLLFKRYPVKIITDCSDEDAANRQKTLAQTLFPGSQIDVINADSTLEASYHLVTTIGVLRGHPAVILVNVAPRDGEEAKEHENGTPFGFLQYGNVSIFTTTDGLCLSLLNMVTNKQHEVLQYHIPDAVESLRLSEEERAHACTSQFRSLDFLPFVAEAVTLLRVRVGGEVIVSNSLPDRHFVAYIDKFGNCKTTMTIHSTSDFCPGQQILFNGTAITCYRQLKDVPDDELGLVIGSSGIGHGADAHRFLEVVVQGGRACDRLILWIASRANKTSSHAKVEPIRQAA